MILLEAKGYRKGSGLNKGQLIKEFLIAAEEAKNNKIENFYVMFIAQNTKQFENFEELIEAQKTEFSNFSNKIERNSHSLNSEGWKKYLTTKNEEFKKHFIWITWDKIKELCTDEDKCQKMIQATIQFHSCKEKENSTKEKWPIFSKLLSELSENKIPLFHFYNGGCGNEILQKYEKEFLEAISAENSPQGKEWEKWHKLRNSDSEVWDNIVKIESERMEAASKLRDAQRKIRKFYLKNSCLLQINKPKNTTRLAFETLGERANLSQSNDSFFTQRCPGKNITGV